MLKYLLLTLLSLPAMAQTLCTPELATMPTLAGGRVKPLVVLAEETLRFVTGKASFNDEPATMVFCKLSFEGMGIPSGIDLPVKVEHIQIKELLGMDKGDDTIAFSKINESGEQVRMAWVGQKENNAYKKELNRVLSRLQTVNVIKNAEAWTLPEVNNGKVQWLPLSQFLTEQKISAKRQLVTDPFQALFQEARAAYNSAEGDHYMTEYRYHKAQLFVWSLVISVVALALTFAVRSPWVGISAAALVILTEVAGITLRVMVSGRAPITNMYETVMFSGFGALVLGLIISIVKKEKFFLLGGLAYNVLCLMMMKFANNMLDPSISPLVPVLRDNFWLSTHVTTIILSYAALALSWILANVILVRQSFKGVSASETRSQMEQVYTCMKVGVTLLSTGIILGGVWADYSWGRFWGWDPKETWSLIVLLVYMAILHGRYSNWISPKRFIPLSAAAFMSVMMAWFGVNYILASGLHSYGFSEGGAIFLGTFFALQTGFLVFYGLKTRGQAST